MKANNNIGVRKGSWTVEEDVLLRKCIVKYGEGNWHQVPPRAGLNRCRKSCRLRWLNYLRPNIKRGEFASDEVDLIIRLHKLLGNRWSLIAGRLPGRTANDVKNYWNTHMQKKLIAPREEQKPKDKKTTEATTIIKPRPRTFSKNVQWRVREETTMNNATMIQPRTLCVNEPAPTLSDSSTDDRADVLQWWNRLLLADKEIGARAALSISVPEDEQPTKLEVGGSIMQEEGLNIWSTGFSVDMDIWSL